MPAGRKRATVEYLEKLVEWAGGKKEFCRRTHILGPNLTAYLNSTKSVTWRRLERATEAVFGVPPAFVPVAEGHDIRSTKTLTFLPTDGGLYGFFDSAMGLIYFGKAANLRAEVAQALKRPVDGVKPWTGAPKLRFSQVTAYISAYRIARGDKTFRHDVEALGLRLFVNSTLNKNHGTFKRRS